MLAKCCWKGVDKYISYIVVHNLNSSKVGIGVLDI